MWTIIKENQNDPSQSMHSLCGKCADEILRFAAKQKTMDNISIVMIGFKKLQDYLDKHRSPQNHSKAYPIAGSASESNVPLALRSVVEKEGQKSQTQKVEGIYKSLN